MSITYNFEISVSKKEGISSIHIIESLLEAGWSLYSKKMRLFILTWVILMILTFWQKL